MTDMSGAFGSRWRNLGIAATAWVGFLPAPTALAADLSTAPVASDYNFVDLKWGPWVELGGTYGTEESSYGEAAVFAPLMQGPDWLAFTEIRGKYFEGDLLEGNAMLGYRKMTGSGFNIGAWAGLDVRHTDSDNTFGQVSGGLEALSEHFDLRINGYYPFSDPQTADGFGEVVLEGNNIFLISGQEVPLYGVDGEIGGRLSFAGNRATIGIYGGGFWFDSDDIDEAITGGSARVELALNDVVGPGSQLSAQYKYTDDNLRGERHLIGARLRIPLGPAPAASSASPQWSRMVDRIERDVDIVIVGSGSGDKEPVEDAITGVDFEEVIQATNDAELAAALIAGPNKLIILESMDPTSYGGGVTVGPNLTLQGGGSTIQVRGLNSGTVADFTAPGSQPVIKYEGNAPVLTVADRTHLAGLDIVGGGSAAGFGNIGVRVLGNSLVAFSDLNVSNTGGIGFGIFKVSDVEAYFDRVSISDTGVHGIDLTDTPNATVTLNDVTFGGVIGNPGNQTDVLIRGGGADLSLNGNIINQATNSPALCEDDFTGTLTYDTAGTSTTITDGVGCK